jgi:hypothetical protein
MASKKHPAARCARCSRPAPTSCAHGGTVMHIRCMGVTHPSAPVWAGGARPWGVSLDNAVMTPDGPSVALECELAGVE